MARALRAGVSAGIKLNSGGAVEPSPATPFPNTVFVVLRGAPGFDPCVTSEASCYFQVVQDQSTDPPRPFHRLLVERFSRLCHSSRGRSLGDWGKSSMATSSAGRAITEEGVLKQLRALNPEAIMAIRDLCSQNHRAGGVDLRPQCMCCPVGVCQRQASGRRTRSFSGCSLGGVVKLQAPAVTSWRSSEAADTLHLRQQRLQAQSRVCFAGC